MSLLLTKPFTDELAPFDDARAFAVLYERTLREIAWRRHEAPEVVEITLIESVPATDAGHICHVCSQVVSWLEHLPPLHAGGPVRCFANVRSISAAPSQRLLGPGERMVGAAVVYSAEYLSTDDGA